MDKEISQTIINLRKENKRLREALLVIDDIAADRGLLAVHSVTQKVLYGEKR